jgi:hypothetical protein
MGSDLGPEAKRLESPSQFKSRTERALALARLALASRMEYLMSKPDTPAGGLRGKDKRQGNLRDTRSGACEPGNESGKRRPTQVREERTPHQDAQPGADVRGDAVPTQRDDALPDGLDRPRQGPLNKSTGRAPLKR